MSDDETQPQTKESTMDHNTDRSPASPGKMAALDFVRHARACFTMVRIFEEKEDIDSIEEAGAHWTWSNLNGVTFDYQGAILDDREDVAQLLTDLLFGDCRTETSDGSVAFNIAQGEPAWGAALVRTLEGLTYLRYWQHGKPPKTLELEDLRTCQALAWAHMVLQAAWHQDQQRKQAEAELASVQQA